MLQVNKKNKDLSKRLDDLMAGAFLLPVHKEVSNMIVLSIIACEEAVMVYQELSEEEQTKLLKLSDKEVIAAIYANFFNYKIFDKTNTKIFHSFER